MKLLTIFVDKGTTRPCPRPALQQGPSQRIGQGWWWCHDGGGGGGGDMRWFNVHL